MLTDDCARPKETQNRTKNQCAMSRDYRIYVNTFKQRLIFLIPDTSKEMTTQKPVKGKNCSRFTSFQLGQVVYAKKFHQGKVGKVMYEPK